MTVLRLLATEIVPSNGHDCISVVDVIEIDITNEKANRATLRRHYNRRWSATSRASHTVQFQRY
jgi:hypothetical protein